MSFGNRTPESLLARSDSKNPATTCKGLTTAGRPCRRALAVCVTNRLSAAPDGDDNGVVAILDSGDAAAFFCWQHKDQADELVASMNQRTQVLPLKQKSSIDTLIERVGVLDLDDEVDNNQYDLSAREVERPRRQHEYHSAGRAKKRNALPREWQRIQGPLMSVPEDVAEYEGYRKPEPPSRPQRRYNDERPKRSNAKVSWSCCTIRADDEDLPPSRRRDIRNDRRQSQTRMRERSRSRPRYDASYTPTHDRYNPPPSPTPVHRKPVSSQAKPRQSHGSINYPELNVSSADFVTPSDNYSSKSQAPVSPPHSQTSALLSLIPQHLSPTVTSTLLSELSKPISSADEEGYIYIFWLTPDSDDAKPDDDTASSLLDPDEFLASSPHSGTPPNNGQRPRSDSNRHNKNSLTAQALRRFASVKCNPTEPTKILLKIGRARNVHRRLSQWTKQCGQNITLIRYYPYHSSGSEQHLLSGSGSPAHTPRRPVPYVHRVERLIHLELAGQRVANKEQCEQCGREHKEWFEVEATREGLKAVDEVVRRWVNWAERNSS